VTKVLQVLGIALLGAALTLVALALVEQRGQWLTVHDRFGRVLVGIPSQAKRGFVHLVATDGSSCDCDDFQNGRRDTCKQTLAVKLALSARARRSR
jgi:hypothetical protein